MNISNLILQLFGGALTGYITNNLAIKMLFKSYGPFGGVIVKTREEFVENISQLVERDIINENTLADSLSHPDIKTLINNMVEHFFNESLQNNTENTIITEIPEINNTSTNFINHFENNIEDYMLKGSGILLPQIKLNQIITNKQYDYISQQFTKQFLNILNSSKELRDNFESLLSDLSNKEIDSFLSPELIEILSKNIKNVLQEIEDNPEYIYKSLNNLNRNLGADLNINTVNKELINIVQNKTLKEYHIDEDYLNNVINNIVKNIKSPNGQEVIFSIYENIRGSLIEDIDSIGDFIDTNQKNELNATLDKKITGTMDNLKSWLLNKQSRIDDNLNGIIDNILEEESKKSPWKSAIKKSAYDYYRKNSSTSPTEILTDSLENIKNNKSLNGRIEDYLYQQLENVDLENVLSQLTITDRQNKQNSASDSIKNESSSTHNHQNNVSNDTIEYLNIYLSNINGPELKEIAEKSINEFIDLDNLNIDFLLKILNKNENIRDYLVDLLLTNIDKEINNLVDTKLDKFIDSQQNNLYYDKIKNTLKDNQDDLQKLVKSNLYKNNAKKTLSQLIDPQLKEQTTLYLKNNTISSHIESEIQEIKNYKINDLLTVLSNRKNFNEKVSENLIYQINNNLPILLKGNISAAIKNNLESVADDDIKNIVEDFVGKELKPITYFGAFLGLCSASLLYLLQLNTTLVPTFQLPVSMLVYGFIGYITNVIAIKMVFRPYDEKKLLGLAVPFTPGVVSKEKNRFAKSVGNFIDEELLNYNTVKNTIQNKKIVIKDIFTKSLVTNNYQLPRKLLVQNTNGIIDIIFNDLEKNRSKLIEYIIGGVRNPSFSENNQEIYDSLSNTITKKTEQYIVQSLPLLSSASLKWLKGKESLSAIIPEDAKRNINIAIEKIIEEKLNSFTKLLIDSQGDKLETVLISFSSKIYEGIKDKTLGDLPEETREILSNILYNLLEKIVISRNDIIKRKINKSIDNYSRVFIDNIPKLLFENKGELKENIISQAEKKMGFWSAAGKLVDFDDTLDEFADVFIEEGLIEILNLFLEDELDDTIKELQFEEKEVTLIIQGLFNNQSYKKFLLKNIDELIKELSHISISDIFSLFEIESPEKLITIFSEEISLIKNSLSKKLSNNKEEVLQITNKAIHGVLEHYFYKIDINKLLNNIDVNIMANSLELLYKQLNTNNSLSTLICTLIKEIITVNSSENHLININYLNKDLNILFKSTITNPMIRADLKKLLNKIYVDLIEQIHEIIDKKTADYLIDILITSLLDTLEEGLPELIEKINIKDITITEIDNMEAKEIEQLFYSFAGNYFGKLENYGWLGGIVGLFSELIKNTI